MDIIEKALPQVKILVATHKPCSFPTGKCFVPIHVGRDVALKNSKDGKLSDKDFNWLLKHTIGDNSGDNISARNRYYNENSSLYWAWKNYDKLDNPDYIGLMHYRRHFVLDNNYWNARIVKMHNLAKGLVCIYEDIFNKTYLKNIGLNDENLREICSNYDAVLSYNTDLTLAYGRSETLRSDYVNNIPGVKAVDFDIMVEIVKHKYPEFSSAIDEYINGDKKYIYQMFIMRKDLFFEYCEFLFGILFEIEQRQDYSSYTINGQRTLGYLAEILLSLFFIIRGTDDLKIAHCGCTFLKNCVPPEEYLKFTCKNFVQNIFSIKNSENKAHKILTIGGVKLKFKRSKYGAKD